MFIQWHLCLLDVLYELMDHCCIYFTSMSPFFLHLRRCPLAIQTNLICFGNILNYRGAEYKNKNLKWNIVLTLQSSGIMIIQWRTAFYLIRSGCIRIDFVTFYLVANWKCWPNFSLDVIVRTLFCSSVAFECANQFWIRFGNRMQENCSRK